jgi:hypothetical protein
MEKKIEVKPDIQLGDVNLGPEYLDKKNHKIRITSWIDGDIYEELNRRAESGEAGGMYQKIMNLVLREALFPQQKFVDEKDLPTQKEMESLSKAAAKVAEILSGKSGKVVAATIAGIKVRGTIIPDRAARDMKEIKKLSKENHMFAKSGKIARTTKKKSV